MVTNLPTMQLSTHQEIQILHVDDNPSITDLTGTFLEREDDRFAVETATSADEGLQRISDHPPDCIVSDYDMPGMDGLKFLQTVREEYPDLPFILFTGKGSETVASDAIAADVTDYLRKGSGTEQYELLANRIRNGVQAERDAQRIDRQEQLMRLTEFTGDTGGFEVDVDSGDLLLTDGARRLVGLPEDAHLCLEEAIELYHPDDQADVRQTLNRAAETGDQTQGTYRLQTLDDDERLVDMRVAPAAGNSDITTLRGAIRDITERRKHVRELTSKQQFIEQALNALDDLFYVVNADGTLRRWNDRSLEVTGYTDNDLTEMNAIELFPEDDHEMIADAIETTLADGQTTVEAHVRTADGERLPYEFTSARLTDEDGTVTGLVGIGRDLTERRQRERRFQALVEESKDNISVIDDNDVFQYQSPAVKRILGYDPEETIGDTVWEYIHPDDRERLESTFEEWVATPGPTGPVEYRARHADGSWRWLEANGNNQFDNPAIQGYVVNSRDITERKEYEQELQTQNERLEEFASIISHDLRSPLHVADARLELIRDECASDHIDDVAQALARMDALIEDVLTLAREGNQVDETESVRLASVVKSSWQMVSTGQATLEVEPSTSRNVEVDRSRLQQLFENLYRNAIEHGGTEVTVSVGAIDNGFYVADTGPGIPPSDREDVFEAGYSTSEDGTGFGLRIVEQIADAHGWEITVTESNEREGGARFEFTGVEIGE